MILWGIWVYFLKFICNATLAFQIEHNLSNATSILHNIYGINMKYNYIQMLTVTWRYHTYIIWWIMSSIQCSYNRCYTTKRTNQNLIWRIMTCSWIFIYISKVFKHTSRPYAKCKLWFAWDFLQRKDKSQVK